MRRNTKYLENSAQEASLAVSRNAAKPPWLTLQLGLLQFLHNNVIYIFDMAQIDHEDALFAIPQVKALLCHVVVVAVVSAGVLV